MELLVADDDPVQRRLLEVMLGRWGYDVRVAADGGAAWEALRGEDAPRIAVLDWMMPSIDGLEVCRRVREAGLPTYVLLLTARNQPEDVASGLEAGANDYLVKPFDHRELRARVAVGRRVVELQASLGQRVEELAESEARIRAIVEASQDAIITIDAAGTIRDLNRAAEQMFGRSREEALGGALSGWLREGRSRERYEEERGRQASACAPAGEPLELHAVRAWGGEFPVDLTVAPVRTPGERLLSVVVRELSGRRRAEVELRHTQKLEAVGQLAAGIAHEINTPIQFVGDNTRFLADGFQSILGLIGTYRSLRDGVSRGEAAPSLVEAVARAEEAADLAYLEREVPKAIAQTLDGVERVATIVRAMKEFAHPSTPEMVPADLNQALRSTLAVARNELKYVADVETQLGELPPVVCQVGDLNQVFLNLLVNAAHAIADAAEGDAARGRITLRTAREGDHVLVAIGDTGGGIPEEVSPHIFEPFFTTKEVGRGTGQGLSIAQAIVVQKHGGTLSFETEIGRGTTFFIRLPIDGARERREVAAA